MPDLTVILIGTAVVIVIAAFLVWRNNKTKVEAIVAKVPAEVVALQGALNKAIDKLHMSTPATPIAPTVTAAKAVTLQVDGTVPMGTTAATWQAPPPPWPIDARYLNAAQVAALTAEETGRANMWAQALMSSAATGNGQNPTGAALMIFRAGFTRTEDLNKPLDPIWQQIFAAYGVPLPSPASLTAWDMETRMPHVTQPGEAAYDVRIPR